MKISPWFILASRPLVLRVDSAFVKQFLFLFLFAFGGLFILHVCHSLPILFHLRLFPLRGSSGVGLFILSRVFVIYR